MPYADVRGVRLSYRQTGRGEDVVLIHGLATSQAFWSLALVARLAEQFRVTTYDLRGHGYSELSESGYRPREMADDLAALMQVAEIDRAHLVGHSFGGLVALEQAVADPARVRSLTLADTRIRALQPSQAMHEGESGEALRGMFERCGVSLADDEPEMGVCLLEALATERWERLRNRLGTRARFVPFAGRRGGRRAASRWLRLMRETTAGRDVRYYTAPAEEQVAALRCPVLTVYGDRSPNRPTAERLQGLCRQAHEVVVPEAGHFHPASRPEAFVAAWLEFWRRTSGAVKPE